MARIYGLNGVLRGRQGNNVFAVQNGTQVVRAYQPVVSNPRSNAQQMVRARFSLAGKISCLTPSLALSGLAGGSNRSRRARFVSGLTKAAVAAPVEGGYNASIALANIKFSEGNIQKWSAVSTPTAVISSGGTIVVTVPAMQLTAGAPVGYQELLIVGVFDVSGSPLDSIDSVVRSSTESNVFRFHQNLPANAVVAIWVAPFIPRSSVAGSRSGNIGISDDNTAATLSLANSTRIAASDWGDTYFASSITLTPSRDGDTEPVAEETKKKR